MHRLLILLVLPLYVTCATSGRQQPAVETGAGRVHALLVNIKIQEQDDAVKRLYKRKEWRHWVDDDGDCQDTRTEILLRDANRATLNRSNCKVTLGVWNDPYTGKTYREPSDIDIDHMVPLKEAHMSGGHAWSAERKMEYANSLSNAYHLIAVQDKANQSKSDRAPHEWMPSNEAYHCKYVEHWGRVKDKWQLTMTGDEFEFVNRKLLECDSR